MLGLFKFKKQEKAEEPTFEKVFKENYDYVLRLAFNLSGNMHDAEDIAQEVFIGVNNGLSSFQGNSQIRTWIYRITIRVATRYLSKHKSKNSYEELSEIEKARFNSKNVFGNDILKIMLKLPLEQRTLISLSAIEGMSHLQIAEILNVPQGTIGSRLHSARKNLMRLVKSSC